MPGEVLGRDPDVLRGVRAQRDGVVGDGVLLEEVDELEGRLGPVGAAVARLAELVGREVGGVRGEDLRRDLDVLDELVLPGPRLEPFLEERRVDGGAVDVDERHVVVQQPVEQDQELLDVRGGHGPEGVLPSPVDVRDQGGDRVGEGVLAEVLVAEGVVAVAGVKADLEVVLPAARGAEDLAHLLAEVALHLEDDPAEPARRVVGGVEEELARHRPDEARRLARADGAEARHPGVEALLGDREPLGSGDAPLLGRVVRLAEDDGETLAPLGGLVGGKRTPGLALARAVEADEEERECRRVHDERRREQEEHVGRPEEDVGRVRPRAEEHEAGLVERERVAQEEDEPGQERRGRGEEELRVPGALEEARGGRRKAVDASAHALQDDAGTRGAHAESRRCRCAAGTPVRRAAAGFRRPPRTRRPRPRA